MWDNQTYRLFSLWAQLGSNHRPPDYESNIFTFHSFPLFAIIFQVADFQPPMFSVTFRFLPVFAIVVYSNVYPLKINMAEIETIGFLDYTIGKSKIIYRYD